MLRQAAPSVEIIACLLPPALRTLVRMCEQTCTEFATEQLSGLSACHNSPTRCCTLLSVKSVTQWSQSSHIVPSLQRPVRRRRVLPRRRLLQAAQEEAQVEVRLRGQQREEGAQVAVEEGVHAAHAAADLAQHLCGDGRRVEDLRL